MHTQIDSKWSEVEKRFEKQFGGMYCDNKCELFHSKNIKSFISQELQHAYTQGRESAVEEVRGLIRDYPQKIRDIMPEGKLPFVIFQGKADEGEKWTIYEQAYKDILALLQNIKSSIK